MEASTLEISYVSFLPAFIGSEESWENRLIDMIGNKKPIFFLQEAHASLRLLG